MSALAVSKLALSCLLAVGALTAALPAQAQQYSRNPAGYRDQSVTRDQVRMIEQEYSRLSNGRMIPDDQLEYYLDRANGGWTMAQISQDMANNRRQGQNRTWQPQAGWNATAVVCSSEQNRYRECAVPFRGRAVLNQQVSQAACVEGQSWGQKQGLVWVNRGCRARFTMVAEQVANPPSNRPTIVCKSQQGAQKICSTGMRGRVELVNRFKNSGACIEGRTWGQRQGQVWVSQNCRARFGAMGRPGAWDDDRYSDRRDDRNDRDDRYDRDDRDDRDDRWVRDQNYSTTCGSNDNQRTRCTWDNRYGSPRVAQRLSQSACVEGSSWGYTERDGLWVGAGCRARFTSR